MEKVYLEYIKKLDIGNAKTYKCKLNSTLKTTNLMTRLRYGIQDDSNIFKLEDQFNVLLIWLLKYGKNEIVDFGKLVVVYIPSSIRKKFNEIFDLKKRNITVTNLKQHNIFEVRDKFKNEKHTTLELSNGESLELWDTPFVLRAVTDFDKDFRKIWRYDDMVYEGNNYGDTTEFYIIGTLGKTQYYNSRYNKKEIIKFYEDRNPCGK